MKWCLVICLSSWAIAKPTCNSFMFDMKQVRWVPYVSDGVLRGYVVRGLKKDSSLPLAGIQEKDLVTEIDGTRLSDENAMKVALDGICSGRRDAQISLLRSGKAISLRVELDLLPR